MSITDAESELVAEQLRHTIDLLRTEINTMQIQISHVRDISDRRIEALETCQQDHEQRLRTVTEGVTQFKTWSGLSNGASTLISLFALFRATIGG